MRAGWWLVLCVTTAGCLTHDTKLDALHGPSTRIPPAAVSADEVHSKNAHDKATALFDELEFDELRKDTAKR